MSYKHKDEIIEDIGSEPNCNYEFEENHYYSKLKEIDHVYTQAAKADELQAELQYKNNMIDNLNGTIERIEKKSGAMQDLIENNEMQEYEAKAEAFDAIMREWEDERMTKSHILETIQKYYDEYESGEPNAKK